MSNPWFTALCARHPWPATAPDVPEDLQGFFDAENVASLRRAFALAPTTSPLVLELGTWKGTSAHWMLSTYPGARVICVDCWTPATTYAAMKGTWDWLAKEPHVYETCQRNLWPFRDRCVLIRAQTVEGLARVAAAGLVPDLVYVDAGHSYEDVSADVRGTLERFPAARTDRTEPGPVILGDDYNQAPVRMAVDEIAPQFHCLVANERSVWRLVPAKTKWGDYPLEYGRLEVAGQAVLDLGAERGTTAQYFLARGARTVFVSEIDVRCLERLGRVAAVDPRVRLLPPLLTPSDYDAWMRTYAPSRVKVDIEGAEVHLLECSEAAFRTPAAYAIETHTPALHARLLARLGRCDYQITITRQFRSNPNVQVLYAVRPS